MSSWFVYYALQYLVGNPLLALVLMVAGGWVLEHYTVGALPTPLRFFRRWGRRSTLRRRLLNNPHDRQARFELAESLVSEGRPGAAVPLVHANVEAGDEDAQTLFLLGKACLRTGHFEQGVKVMRAALEEDPKVRQGDGWLELGRAYLERRQFAEARAALEQFAQQRTGTVEGRVLLARALAGQGEGAAAEAMRARAWTEYASSPGYIRRQERLWAWRVKPSRPVFYGALTLAVLVLAVRGIRSLPAGTFASAAPGLTGMQGMLGDPSLTDKREALYAINRVTNPGRKGPGAAALREAGCLDAFVADRAEFLAAYHRVEESSGISLGRRLPTTGQKLLVQCVGATLPCDEVAARWVKAAGNLPSAFTVAVYQPGEDPSCITDFGPDGAPLSSATR